MRSRAVAAGGEGSGCSERDIVIRAAALRAMKQEIAEITARHTGQSVATVIADGDRDRWFTAVEARDYGLVDHVVGG